MEIMKVNGFENKMYNDKNYQGYILVQIPILSFIKSGSDITIKNELRILELQSKENYNLMGVVNNKYIDYSKGVGGSQIYEKLSLPEGEFTIVKTFCIYVEAGSTIYFGYDTLSSFYHILDADFSTHMKIFQVPNFTNEVNEYLIQSSDNYSPIGWDGDYRVIKDVNDLSTDTGIAITQINGVDAISINSTWVTFDLDYPLLPKYTKFVFNKMFFRVNAFNDNFRFEVDLYDRTTATKIIDNIPMNIIADVSAVPTSQQFEVDFSAVTWLDGLTTNELQFKCRSDLNNTYLNEFQFDYDAIIDFDSLPVS